MIYGTNHFISEKAALDYYKSQYHFTILSHIHEKIDSRDIVIGEPHYDRKAQKCFIKKSEGRYYIEDKS